MLTGLLLKKFIKNYEDTQNSEVRKKYNLLEGWVSIFGNTLLAAYKIAAGALSGSIAVTADGFHTLSDVLSSMVVVITAHFSSKREDSEHPFGHGRSDMIGSMMVAVLLAVAGVEFFKSALDRILHPEPILINGLVWSAVISSIIIKEWMARFSITLGKKVNSSILKADGGHHRSDALSSIVVLAGIGIQFYFSAKLPGFLGWIALRLDGFIGIILSFFIFYTAYQIIKESASDLLGKAPDPSELLGIRNTALQVKGIRGVHDIIVHQYGSRKVISLHAEVPYQFSLVKAHALAEEVEEKIARELGYFATVHIDPFELDDPRVKAIHDYLSGILKEASLCAVSIHDVRLIRKDKKSHLAFDVSLNESLKEDDENKMKVFLTEKLRSRFQFIDKIFIQIEPLFTY